LTVFEVINYNNILTLYNSVQKYWLQQNYFKD